MSDTFTYLKSQFERLTGILIALVVIGYFSSYFYTNHALLMGLSILIFIILIIVLPTLSGSSRILTYTLAVTAVFLFIITGASFSEWIEGIRINLTLVTIISFVPMLGIPIRQGNYLEALQVSFRKLNDSVTFLFLGSQFLTHVIGIVLNIGSISIMHYLSQATNIPSNRLLVNAINRGFITALMWSPYFSSMALVLSHLPIRWSSIALYLLGIVIISFIVSTLVEWKRIKEAEKQVREDSPNEVQPSQMDETLAKKKTAECFLLLFLMILTVFIIERVTTFSMVVIICSVAVLFPALWSIIFRKPGAYQEEIKTHIFKSLPGMKKEIALFFVAGFFSAGFIQTNLSSSIVGAMNQLFGSFTMGLTFSITLLIIVTAVVGLHPIVTVTIFVTSFNPESLGISPAYFAVLLLSSWGISNTLSPASAVNNLLSNFYQLKITDVSYRWNVIYVLIMALILPIYLALVGL